MTLLRRLLPSLALLVLLAAPGAARADDPVAPQQQWVQAASSTPPGFQVTQREALSIARRLPAYRRFIEAHPAGRVQPLVSQDGLWQLDYRARARDRDGRPAERNLLEVDVDGHSGKVVGVWSGIKADDYLARGDFGLLAHGWYVWLPLGLLFLAPFFDRRRPLRILHLDLLVLLGFGVSHAFFAAGHVELSAPLVYPVLAYLLARMLFVGLRPRVRRAPLVPWMGERLLAAGLLVLVAARIALNFTTHLVMDIGYSGAVGAARILHNAPLYVDNQFHGDTYGPFNYLVYVPFNALFGFDGRWTNGLPSAHAVAILFDLLTIGGLVALGHKLRSGRQGRVLGLALAWAWAAYPYTLFALVTNTNDTLVSAAVVWALVAVASPARRGFLIGLGAAAKFAPLALAPLFATGRERRPRPGFVAAGALLAVVVVSVAAYTPVRGGLHAFWNCTIGYQLTRQTDFSIWMQHPGLHLVQLALDFAAAALAIGVAFFPRKRDVRQIAALAAAVLVAIELPARHWFYFYIVWFAPLVLVALFAMYETRGREREPVDEIEISALLGRTRLPV